MGGLVEEKELNQKFKYDIRNGGVGHALHEVHKFNQKASEREQRDRQNAMEGMASNILMPGYKGGFGWRPNPRAGKRTVTSAVLKDGVPGLLDRVFYDGELVAEVFRPTE